MVPGGRGGWFHAVHEILSLLGFVRVYIIFSVRDSFIFFSSLLLCLLRC